MTESIIELPTYERAVELLNKNVENMGADYVYKSPSIETTRCVYFYNGQPSCIVGHVLADLGMSAFRNNDSRNAMSASNILGEIYGDNAIHFKTRQLLRVVQRKQDNGTPWGVAVEQAIAESS